MGMIEKIYIYMYAQSVWVQTQLQNQISSVQKPHTLFVMYMNKMLNDANFVQDIVSNISII